MCLISLSRHIDQLAALCKSLLAGSFPIDELKESTKSRVTTLEEKNVTTTVIAVIATSRRIFGKFKFTTRAKSS